MKILAFAFPLISAVLPCTQALGDPVQFDTADAHVVVVRPIDMWSGSERATEFLINSYKSKHVMYWYFDDAGNRKTWAGQDELPKMVAPTVEALGFIHGGNRGSIFIVKKPVTVAPADMDAIINQQQVLYDRIVMKSGNPAQLADKTRNSEWLSGVFSLAVAGVGIKTFGVGSVAGNAITSGAAQQTYQFAMEVQKSLVPVSIPSIDFRGYKSVDVRKVEQGSDRAGEIIIAYKETKTPEAERDALAKAIVTVSGADSTLEEIQKSQANDLARRQAVWDACVEAGQCKKD